MSTASLRRSARLNNKAGEVQHVRLPYAPKKRRQPVVPETVDGQSKRKLSLNDPPQPRDVVPPPIPIDTLRDWGLDCNLSPAELTDAVLLSGCAKMVYNDEDEMEQ